MPNNLLNNRYKIIRSLGSGGFGNTFLAEDTYMPSGRLCVVKQLKPVTTSSEIYQLVRERFQREAAILEELGAGNGQIPQLYAYFTEGGEFYLVQEWIEGIALSTWIKEQGAQSESAVQEILANLLPVLAYVHSKGIIHRDIKPDNILLRSSDQKPVLIDFGAVRETMGTIINTQGNATSSIVIGTPGFMPSEQAAGRATYASDIYSLGLTAIYLLSGRIPQKLATDNLTGEIIWRSQIPAINPSLAMVLEKAVMSHHRDRFPTAKAMLTALQPSAPAPVPSTVVPTSAPPDAAYLPTVASSPIANEAYIPTVATSPPKEVTLTAKPASSATRQPTSPKNSQKGLMVGGIAIAVGLIAGSVIIGLAMNRENSPQETISSVQESINSSSETSESPQPRNIPPSPPSLPSSPPLPPKPGVNPQAKISEKVEDFGWLSARPITEKALEGKSAWELDIMRNAIFARHGRKFNNPELQSYFSQQPWYKPLYAPEEFPTDLITSIEEQNAARILQYQDRNGLRYIR